VFPVGSVALPAGEEQPSDTNEHPAAKDRKRRNITKLSSLPAYRTFRA